jgi:hypothetical protein
MSEQEIRATAIKIVIDWLCRNGISEPWDVIVTTADKTANYIRGEQK